ncbi:YvcK family protein [Candidatus Gottesmanbacteria bacterium]|nr:YvcK family protein [Candidatus Gottesmanbacteria bacterium]
MRFEKNVVVIGGGTGTYSVLTGLKKYVSDITAVVTMADSGGSAKKERDEWGLLPSSDVRKSLLALADVSTQNALLLRKLFQYRYSQGVGVRGMTFGNLFLVALTKILGSQQLAIEKAGEILRTHGKVLPVSLDKIDLVATYADGSKVIGEHAIDEPKHNGKIPITYLSTHPLAQINPEVKEALSSANLIILGPGGFYTTLIANLVVSGVSDAIIKSRAKKIFILNLMTEYGQTYGFTASKFLSELDTYLPIKTLDFVFINNAPIPQAALTRYKKYNAVPVLNDVHSSSSFTVMASDLLSRKIVPRQKGDTLHRSFIRHSPEKIAKACMKILNLV